MGNYCNPDRDNTHWIYKITMKKFHLIKNRYLFDDYESGLYFDLCPITRGAGDENALNEKIEKANSSLNCPPDKNLFCTLFLTEAQISKIPKNYQNMFAGKTYLLLFKSGFDESSEFPENAWSALGANGMICDPETWTYYTTWSADNLSHRFRLVSKNEVDNYKEEVTTPGKPIEDTTSMIIHICCPHCGKKIF